VGANVFYSSEHATLSDVNGVFQLSVPDAANQFTVSYLGYETWTQALSARDHYEISLISSGKFLEQVVVSAAKQEQKVEETTVSITSIQPYLIRNTITTNLENTIRQI